MAVGILLSHTKQKSWVNLPQASFIISLVEFINLHAQKILVMGEWTKVPIRGGTFLERGAAVISFF